MLTLWTALRKWALVGLVAMDSHGVLALPDGHSSYLLLDQPAEAGEAL